MSEKQNNWSNSERRQRPNFVKITSVSISHDQFSINCFCHIKCWSKLFCSCYFISHTSSSFLSNMQTLAKKTYFEWKENIFIVNFWDNLNNFKNMFVVVCIAILFTSVWLKKLPNWSIFHKKRASNNRSIDFNNADTYKKIPESLPQKNTVVSHDIDWYKQTIK